MVDALRSGVQAARTVLGGMVGGMGYAFTQDGGITPSELVVLAAGLIVVIGAFIALDSYYELRDGNQITEQP